MDKYHLFKIDTVNDVKTISFENTCVPNEKSFVTDFLHFVLQTAWLNLDLLGVTPHFNQTQSQNSTCFQLCFEDNSTFGLFIKYDYSLKNPFSVKVVAPALNGEYAHCLYTAVSALFSELQNVKVCHTVFHACQELAENLNALKKQIQTVYLSSKLYSTIYQESISQSNNLFAIFSRDNIFAYWTDNEIQKDFLIQYDTVMLQDTEPKYFLSIKSRDKSSKELVDVNTHWFQDLKNDEWQLLEYFSWNSIKELEYMLSTPTHLKAFSILLNCIKHNTINSD